MSSKRKKHKDQICTNKRIISESYEQMYENKLDNLDEMDKFLENHKLPKLRKKHYQNRPITSKDNELLILKRPPNEPKKPRLT